MNDLLSRSRYLIDRSNQLWFSAAFAIFLYFIYEVDEKIDAIKQIEFLKFVGIMSYSLYLLHVPFQGKVINLGSKFIEPQSLMILPLQFTGWLVALIGSYIFYLLIEKKLNYWRCRKKKLN